MLQIFYLDVACVSQICCKCTFHMLHTYVAFKVFHAAHLLVIQRVKGAGVMVAPRRHRGMRRDELGAGGWGALEAGGRCAIGAERECGVG
jgi:hypothetical protein